MKLPKLDLSMLRGKNAMPILGIGAAALVGYFVVKRTMPATAATPVPANATPTSELLASLVRSTSESAARVATAALGPGASIAIEGVRLAGDVTNTIGRLAERTTSALEFTTVASIDMNRSAIGAFADLASRAVEAAAVRVPLGATFGVFPGEKPEGPVTGGGGYATFGAPPAAAAIAAMTPPPLPPTQTIAPVATAARAQFDPGVPTFINGVLSTAWKPPTPPAGQRIKLANGEWITV